MNTRLLALSIGAAVLVGCGGGGSDSTGAGPGPGGTGGATSTRLWNVAIADAHTLFIVQPSPSPALRTNGVVVNVGGPKLYKITADNQVLEVTQTCAELDDATGAKLREFPCTTALTPSQVYDAGSEYVFIEFMQEAVLVRKADGAVFRATDLPRPAAQPSGASVATTLVVGSKTVQTDAAGNMYWANQRVVKVDVRDPAALTGAVLTPDTDQAWQFLVNGAGDVWYGTTFSSRVRFAATGGFAFAPRYTPWDGLDGHFYAFKTETAPGSFTPAGTRIVRLRVSEASVVEEPAGLAPVQLVYTAAIGDNRLMTGWRVDMGPRVLVITGSKAIEVQDPEHPVVHDVACLGFGGVASGEAIWSLVLEQSGGRSLRRWSIASGCTTVTTPAQYDVASFTVGADDVAQFQALRMADGRKVFASVNAAGTVTVLDEAAPPATVTLERIR